MTCVAIDDEPRALEVIKSHASKVPFLSLMGTFADPFEAVTFVNENDIDLIFLDINMPEIDGLNLVKNFTNSPLIIFTTAHSEYAVQSYEVHALDYLLKPFDAGRFLNAVTKAKSIIDEKSSTVRDFFFVNTGTQNRRLFYKNILYIEGDGNYVNYYCANRKVMVRSSIKETLANLPSDAFIQVHRSFIVSLSCIDKIEDNHIYIADVRVPISATYKAYLMRLVKG